MKILNSSAGSGKTTRLIKELENFKNPLIISFTKASCEDIYKRSGIKAYTLHSFCYNFLNKKEIAENQTSLIKMNLGKFNILSTIGIDQVVSLYNSYSIFQNLQPLENFQCEKDILDLNLEFQALAIETDKVMENYNLITFSHVIRLFLDNIQNYLYRINNTYDSLFIDEAQDFSQIQLDIIKVLIEEIFINKFFFIVGDIKQSLYEFQGASVQYYKDFLSYIITKCKSLNINISIEENNKTYRFGGDILKHINENFIEHESNKTEGIFQEFHGDITDCEIIIRNAMETYKVNEICVLYERCITPIVKLQQNLNCGFSIKIYDHPIIDAFHTIAQYLLTENLWYAVQILQSPFFYCPEPLLQINLAYDLTYGKDFLQKIKDLKNSPLKELFEFLANKIHTDELGELIFKKLYTLSFNSSNIFDFVWNLPSQLEIYKPGINFYTVHSSKGLEFPFVLFINLLNKKINTPYHVNLNPFFISKDKPDQCKENILYVAKTRAIKELIIVNIN